jgi:hypothetical protein
LERPRPERPQYGYSARGKPLQTVVAARNLIRNAGCCGLLWLLWAAVGCCGLLWPRVFQITSFAASDKMDCVFPTTEPFQHIRSGSDTRRPQSILEGRQVHRHPASIIPVLLPGFDETRLLHADPWPRRTTFISAVHLLSQILADGRLEDGSSKGLLRRGANPDWAFELSIEIIRPAGWPVV